MCVCEWCACVRSCLRARPCVARDEASGWGWYEPRPQRRVRVARRRVAAASRRSVRRLEGSRDARRSVAQPRRRGGACARTTPTGAAAASRRPPCRTGFWRTCCRRFPPSTPCLCASTVSCCCGRARCAAGGRSVPRSPRRGTDVRPDCLDPGPVASRRLPALDLGAHALAPATRRDDRAGVRRGRGSARPRRPAGLPPSGQRGVPCHRRLVLCAKSTSVRIHHVAAARTVGTPDATTLSRDGARCATLGDEADRPVCQVWPLPRRTTTTTTTPPPRCRPPRG